MEIDTAVEVHSVALREHLEAQRRSFVADGPPSVAVRCNRIDRCLPWSWTITDAFVDAMAADFGTRSKPASLFTEVVGIIPVLEHTRSHVARWRRSTNLMRAARLFGLRAEVERDSIGGGRDHRSMQSRGAAGGGGLRGGQPVMIKMRPPIREIDA